MKKLTRVKLINWHRFTNTLIDFERTTLISGENGAGKSTLLDALQFVVTCSTSAFNKAAHENGKRKLTGYIRCKTGRESKPYERTGEISAHVALEFYEESRKQYFVLGAVVDSSSIGQEKTVRYLMENIRLDDQLFFNGRVPKSITQFKTTNSKKIKDWCTTDREAKSMVKNRFGRIEDKFFKLIPKALAFRPIDDIKDFVYSYVLDDKEVNIDVLRENVRTYQDLLQTLSNIKIRMEKLERIEYYYRQAEDGMEKDKMYDYFLQRAEADTLAEQIVALKKDMDHTIYKIDRLEQDIEAKQKEKRQHQEMRDNLYAELASDKDFLARDEQQKRLSWLEAEKESLNSEKKNLTRSVNKAKAEVHRLQAYAGDVADIVDYADQLERLEKDINLIDFMETISKVITYKRDTSAKMYQASADLDLQIRNVAEELQGLDLKIQNLRKKKMTYPQEVNVTAHAIKEKFLEIGRTQTPRILCELLEITDPTWRNAVEGYLNTQRFYILVEPNSFDIALGTYDQLRKERKAYGVGLINTQKLDGYDIAPEGSLASVVTSENKYAKRYINMVLGKVMMCDHYSQLKNHKTAITRECMRYHNHVASAIKPAIFETPYIGKEAISVQLTQAEAQREKIKTLMTDLQTKLQDLKTLQKDLSTEADTDIKYRVHVIHDLEQNRLEIEQCKANITTLEKNSGMILKQIQLSQLEQMTVEFEQKLSSLVRHLGEQGNHLETIKGTLIAYEVSYEEKKSAYVALGARFEEHLMFWNKEYDKQTQSKTLDQFRENFARRRKANQTTTENCIDSMKKVMIEYKTAHDFGAAPTLEGYPDFELEYIKLKDSELLSYEGKVESARQSAEEEFREQFLAKLQENMKTAQTEFKELNKALKDIEFSNEKYEFHFMPSKKYRHYYEMIMDDFNAIQGESIFSGAFHENHKEVIDELFERLALDNDNNAKVLEEFTDYRTYMDYDIKIIHSDETYSLYSKVCEEKSGGETQTPFYVTVAASFVQLYKNCIGKEAVGLVLFDEAFNNMDDERIGGVLEFLRRLPLQILIAAPPDKIQYISPFVEETLLVMSDERVSFVERYYNGAL